MQMLLQTLNLYYSPPDAPKRYSFISGNNFECGICLNTEKNFTWLAHDEGGDKHPIHKNCLEKMFQAATPFFCCPICRCKVSSKLPKSFKERVGMYLNDSASYLAPIFGCIAAMQITGISPIIVPRQEKSWCSSISTAIILFSAGCLKKTPPFPWEGIFIMNLASSILDILTSQLSTEGCVRLGISSWMIFFEREYQKEAWVYLFLLISIASGNYFCGMQLEESRNQHDLSNFLGAILTVPTVCAIRYVANKLLASSQ